MASSQSLSHLSYACLSAERDREYEGHRASDMHCVFLPLMRCCCCSCCCSKQCETLASSVDAPSIRAPSTSQDLCFAVMNVCDWMPKMRFLPLTYCTMYWAMESSGRLIRFDFICFCVLFGFFFAERRRQRRAPMSKATSVARKCVSSHVFWACYFVALIGLDLLADTKWYSCKQTHMPCSQQIFSLPYDIQNKNYGWVWRI